ncbi:MAG: alpha/beta fold hydrolase [Proteobacteria bacterium]|nr:alpha/beta fold hydrolase [Pseudomonadota bacterium]NIS70773.1 alpha/beta fold hydrolase [Pseudomonadota bacterium]
MSAAKTEEPVVFKSGGLQLEGLLWRGDPRGDAFVLCHPHPEYGGNMDNNVVSAMATAFQAQGISTIRFNFRGVGKSEGRFGGGTEERLDVEAAIDALGGYVNPRGVHVGGYSFGAHVGLNVASVDDRIDGFVGVAPPLALYDFEFLRECAKRKLFIAGSEDLFCPPGRLREWFDSLQGPKALKVIPDADHFFWNQEASLKEAVGAYFALFSSQRPLKT